MTKHRATIEDVASLAGVSIKTVSRVVNREANVSAATTEKVEKAITTLEYRPNPSARNLASHHAHLIVLVYDDPSAYDASSAGYIINMQEGALRACRSEGFELLIHPCNHREKGVGAELQEQIRQVRPSGIVVAAPLSNMPVIVDAVKATNTPYVRLSTGTGNGDEYEVATNDREISAEMTRYLASLGHTRIAFIKGDPTARAVGNRYVGYEDGLEQSGLPLAKELVAEGDLSIGSGEKCAEQLLQLENPPTAIFSANDDMAAGVIRVANRMGISIPRELSVAGCDDIALAQMIFPALTTIRQPLSAMAYAASKALIDGARGHPHEPGLEIVPGAIKKRESTAAAPKNA
ncbi:MAG: LacI family DNA-binding transcriptional regulator [Gammaproteobacteria bacterium]|nr:LacI family DNA-binding transcriptional regulator [Gammaproteobacteria bacterium]MDH5240403.1 LacI family DNA-binding transcriptional regulator [Gammaproteobacteria bacterium]MDH5262082.1 LacI family DNA-binding transcriptional regulator [Gammaproteobacteria bacterium]MDH5583915.1 LacI family DNA-binding transcriptional regulator [Gammaproteobacteria bacterium]